MEKMLEDYRLAVLRPYGFVSAEKIADAVSERRDAEEQIAEAFRALQEKVKRYEAALLAAGLTLD